MSPVVKKKTAAAPAETEVHDTKVLTAAELYQHSFKGYPDVLNVEQVSEVLGISTKSVYKLLKDSSLKSLKIGREFKIPKLYVLQYLKILAADIG